MAKDFVRFILTTPIIREGVWFLLMLTTLLMFLTAEDPFSLILALFFLVVCVLGYWAGSIEIYGKVT